MTEKFGERIRRKRMEKRLGLRETAKLIDRSPTYLSRLERLEETHPPSEDVIRSLAKVLDDDFHVLMQLAGRIPTDLADFVKSDPRMPEFLRTAREQNLSAEELMKMLEQKKKGE